MALDEYVYRQIRCEYDPEFQAELYASFRHRQLAQNERRLRKANSHLSEYHERAREEMYTAVIEVAGIPVVYRVATMDALSRILGCYRQTVRRQVVEGRMLPPAYKVLQCDSGYVPAGTMVYTDREVMYIARRHAVARRRSGGLRKLFPRLRKELQVIRKDIEG